MSAKLPDNVSFETAAPLACAGVTIYKGILQSGCKSGEWLGIVGSGGGLGHLGVQFAKALGIKVAGIDARDSALEMTRSYGADVTVDAREGDDAAAKAVLDATPGGEGCKSTLVVSDAKGAAALACRITRMHGTVVQIAQPDEVVIPFAQLVFRDVRVKGSLVANPEEAARMLEDVAKYGVTVTTHPVKGLDRVPELVELAHSGKLRGKGIVVIDQAQIDEQNKQGIKMV
ncbi:MAG: zinc-binding dehydrogenase [Terriglobus roseus]|nr:zinc-binding dehydrogenase [Terriglobus roseus]